ncbi:hypothetical protein GDO86_007395 [Hymenochirus boettgeri]|uniref:Fibronectin type-III domain-containing protein n=1 Tax=Hymenochirus boettgeri TaxID=247094 RepID=A0A8T2IWD7_9PIPI|nr:hypothetical protein GDO86_007395 [Hymenochirus boettgeri]
MVEYKVSILVLEHCGGTALLLQHPNTGSALLDSLNCVNDYKTHWKCQWQENMATHKLLPISLYHWNTVNRYVCWCVEFRAKFQEGDGPELSMSCSFKSTFMIYMNDSYTFVPEKPVQTEATIIPAHNVRTPPPNGLLIHRSNDGTFILRWKSPVAPSLHLNMLYQIAYRKMEGEHWENSTSIYIWKELEVSLNTQLFVPGTMYIFRVRTQPHEKKNPRGFWSNWSEGLTMEVPKEDDAAPRNLHCEYNGITSMKCTWEVRTEVTLSVSYALFYREEKVCLPKKTGKGSYVLYSCTMDLTPEQANSTFSVQVKLLEEVKTFLPRENIQTQPPMNLSVEERSGRAFILRWSPPNLSNIHIHPIYQLCYWKEGDPPCPTSSLLNISGTLPEYYVLASNLTESRNYTAKVRTRLDGSQSSFSGPWSDWSQTISWKTKKGVDNLLITIVTPLASLLLFTCLYLGYKLMKRSKERWEVSLPNPSKSKLLSNYQLGFWHLAAPTHFIEEFTSFERGQCICFVERVVSDRWGKEEKNKKENEQSIECTGDGGEQHSTNLPYSIPSEQEAKLGHNESDMMVAHAHSMSDLVDNNVQNTGYFTLPRPQTEVFTHSKKQTPLSPPVFSQDRLAYVFGMGTQQPPPVPKSHIIQDHEKRFNVIHKHAPTDSNLLAEGPFMVLTADGMGPLMLKQIGDYCFFPGLKGSQEKLEEKQTQLSVNKEQQIIEDHMLPAVQAFKVMQHGYFALPQT